MNRKNGIIFIFQKKKSWVRWNTLTSKFGYEPSLHHLNYYHLKSMVQHSKHQLNLICKSENRKKQKKIQKWIQRTNERTINYRYCSTGRILSSNLNGFKSRLNWTQLFSREPSKPILITHKNAEDRWKRCKRMVSREFRVRSPKTIYFNSRKPINQIESSVFKASKFIIIVNRLWLWAWAWAWTIYVTAFVHRTTDPRFNTSAKKKQKKKKLFLLFNKTLHIFICIIPTSESESEYRKLVKNTTKEKIVYPKCYEFTMIMTLIGWNI